MTAESATRGAPRKVRFNPFSAEFRHDPYPVYRLLRETAPVHDTLGMWVLTRHRDVRAVLHDRTFSAGLIPQLVSKQAGRLAQDEEKVRRIERLGVKSLVFTDNPEHARLRGLVNRVFTGRTIAGLRPRVTAIAEELVRRAWDRGGMDVIADFAALLPERVMCDWMDLPSDLRAEVGRWTHDVRFLLEPGLMREDDFTRVCDVVETFTRALCEVIADRAKAPGDDLISALLAARTAGGDRLGDEELAFICIMCFVAGNETTKSLIGNGVLALSEHPAQAALLHRSAGDADVVRGAVDEALRYDCPLQMTKRLATRDVEIGGRSIRAGDQVLLCLGAANRDPEAFPDPDRFDIARGATGHLAFGHGMHGCLGGALAELQAGIAFAHLYRRPERMELTGEPLRRQRHSFIVRGLERLPVDVRESAAI